MPSALALIPDCTATCAPVVTSTPGPAGAAGTNGTNGTNGVNAYTTATVAFTMPAEAANVVATVGNSDWMTVGQKVFASGGGFRGTFEVISKGSSTTVTLRNEESTAGGDYVENSPPGSIFPIGTAISPSGLQGPDGALTGAAGGDLESTYPSPRLAVTTTKGDLIVNNNAAVIPRNTRLAVGTNGQALHADSTTGTGLRWGGIDLGGTNTSVSGITKIANGGTNSSTALSNNRIMTSQAGAIAEAAALTNGQILIGSTGVAPVAAALTAGAGITITNAAGAITIAASAVVPYVLVIDKKTAGLNGGDFTSGGWRQRDANTLVADTSGLASVALNNITLAAGTWRCRIRCPAYLVDNHQARLYNVTGATVLQFSNGSDAYGTSEWSASAGDESVTHSEIVGRFILAASTAIRIEHRCQTTNLGDGFGRGATFGGYETFSTYEFFKEV